MRRRSCSTDADLDTAAKFLSANKYRNAGQVCVSPTRFLVQEKVYKQFVDKFVTAAKAIKVGDGLKEDTRMGPLAHSRRLDAMEGFIADAVAKGATVETGGRRIGNKGYFFEPTVLTNVPREARIMNEEPFGPVRDRERVRQLRRSRDGGKPAAVWPRRLCLHALDQDRGTPSATRSKAAWCRSTTTASRCRKCASAASRIPATAARAAPTRSTPTSIRSSSPS